MKESIKHCHYGIWRSSFQAQFAFVLHSGQLSHTHCMYSQSCVWKYSSKTLLLAQSPSSEHTQRCKIYYPPHSCTGTSDICNTALVPVFSCMTPLQELTESPAPELPPYGTTTWPGTPALLKSGQEYIHWVPKHTWAPLKAGILNVLPLPHVLVTS